MNFVSYAQNFEDVILWRSLADVPNGFYIDVGAQHPVYDSVSKAFYEHGWRGVHVEATATYAALLREDRPDELVLQVALNHESGSIPFYEIPDTGLSTGDESIADHHRAQNYSVIKTEVLCITLADVFSRVGSRDIHWLKIDVEGMEQHVLTGWGEHPHRPWILVIESTYPNSQIETHERWEYLLMKRGYKFAYFDGLSRYYLYASKLNMLKNFLTPPNIFDGFSLAASVPCNGQILNFMQEKEQQYKNKIIELKSNYIKDLKADQDKFRLFRNSLKNKLQILVNEIPDRS